MPHDAKPHTAYQRFATSAGRFGITLLVEPAEYDTMKAIVKLKDHQPGFDADDPPTEEFTMESAPAGTNNGLADWLINRALPALPRSDFMHKRPASSLLEIQNAMVKLVHQLLGRHDNVDIKR
jgi:hypothetical protein